MRELVRKITRCRACASDRLDVVLELGTHCISDFVEDGQEPDRAPLTLVRCHDCTLVQLQHTVDRDRLYKGTYWYHSGTNESMVVALRDVVIDASRRTMLRPGDTVLDIGANDGTLLRLYLPGLYRIGVEPAKEFQDNHQWMGPGDTWMSTYFPVPDWMPRTPAKVITSIAMFYDLDDPSAFVAAIKEWLHPEGIWVCQMMDLHQMLAKNAFDNICHEHLGYYSYHSFRLLVERHGLEIVDMSSNETNGGSIRYIVKHAEGRGTGWTPPGVVEHSADDIGAFAKRVKWGKADVLRMFGNLMLAKAVTLGYGASTKGNTLLQYYGIGPDLLPAIADRNPDKWGKRTVGSNIPIISEAEMRATNPDYLFVLPWHFIDVFVQRERAWLEGGGRFILPLPRLKEVDRASLQPKDTASVVGTGSPA